MRYAAGTFESMRTRFAPNAGGANIAVASDVPPGSGLSSSASLEVSIATALEHLWGVTIDPVEKAKACQSAEHEYAGAPCGLMDQLVSVMGKRGCAIRIDCRDATTTAVPMPPADEAVFVIFDSAVSHANDDGGYAARRAACESSLPKLGVRALRDVAPDRLGSLPDDLTPVEIDAVRHVVSENARVEAFTSLLPQAKLAEAGALMNESHRSLSETYRVSCPEVDTLAEIVRGAARCLRRPHDRRRIRRLDRLADEGRRRWSVSPTRCARRTRPPPGSTPPPRGRSGRRGQAGPVIREPTGILCTAPRAR
jgi:galactokinase